MAERDTEQLLNDPTPKARDALIKRTLERFRLWVRCLKHRRGVSALVETDAVVDDVWLRILLRPDPPEWANRSHFLRYMAAAMSSVLIDHLRASERGDRRAAPLEAANAMADRREPNPEELARFHELAAAIAEHLTELARDEKNGIAARVLELDLEGWTIKEIAAEVGLADPQVYRARARARQHLDKVLSRSGFGC